MRLQRCAVWFVALAAALPSIGLTASIAEADTIRTPINSAVTLRGTSGGGRSSSCGSIANNPNHQLVVTEALVSLRFTVRGQGEPTLLIQSGDGRSECVMSDRLSQGVIELPGAWEQGNYSIYIGDRSGGSHSYTLSVVQE